jgi:hypothetical protein
MLYAGHQTRASVLSLDRCVSLALGGEASSQLWSRSQAFMAGWAGARKHIRSESGPVHTPGQISADLESVVGATPREFEISPPPHF